jgi:dihydroxyacetone kinase-like protein
MFEVDPHLLGDVRKPYIPILLKCEQGKGKEDRPKAVKEQPPQSVADVAAAFAAGVQAIQQRGKADVGEKTMLDVLIPVARAFTQLSQSGAGRSALLAALKREAEAGMLSTRDMIATKGRAAFLGERAVGHIDPGAKTSQLIICTVCDLALQDH